MKTILTVLAIALAAPATADTLGPYTSLLVFGDSLSDPGNVKAFSGGTNPNPAFYPDGQFTNGDTWAVQLGSGVGENFAYGGARAADNGDAIPDLNAQIDIFQTVAPSLGDNPLTAIWAGGNDLRDLGVDIFTASATITDPTELGITINTLVGKSAEAIASSIAGGVARLVTESGLDDFLVFFVPDLSTIPALVNTENAPLFAGIVNATNAAIQFAVSQTAALLPLDITVDFFDPNLVAAEIFAAPEEFGINFTETQCLSTTGFCGLENAPDYYFFDDIHPTEAVHAALADAVRAQVVPLPGGMSLALGGFALLGFAARRRRKAS